MACKHEGGTDKCHRYKDGHCAFLRRTSAKKRYARNGPPRNVLCANLPATKSDAGQAAEYFVAADLLARGCDVTKPLNTNSPHDLFAKVNGKWLSIQVKSARINIRTGTLLSQRRAGVISDVLTLVHFPTLSIRYINTREGTDCQFSSTTAERASALPNTESATHKLSPASSATYAEASSTCSSVFPHGSKQGSTEKETVSVRIAEYADYWPPEDQDAETSDEEVGALPHPPKPELDAEVDQ